MVCIICEGPMPKDYDPKFCCSGMDCSCQALPIDPPTCSKKCDDVMFSKLKGSS